MMKKNSILAVLLVLVAALFVACSNGDLGDPETPDNELVSEYATFNGQQFLVTFIPRSEYEGQIVYYLEEYSFEFNMFDDGSVVKNRIRNNNRYNNNEEVVVVYDNNMFLGELFILYITADDVSLNAVLSEDN